MRTVNEFLLQTVGDCLTTAWRLPDDCLTTRQKEAARIYAQHKNLFLVAIFFLEWNADEQTKIGPIVNDCTFLAFEEIQSQTILQWKIRINKDH